MSNKKICIVCVALDNPDTCSHVGIISKLNKFVSIENVSINPTTKQTGKFLEKITVVRIGDVFTKTTQYVKMLSQ